jgi:Ca2+-binding RTX toxin-like protein
VTGRIQIVNSTVIVGIIAIIILLSQIIPMAVAHDNKGTKGRLHISDNLVTPTNQNSNIPSNAIAGSDIPKNLIIAPACASNCPPIIGTNRDDVIDASDTIDTNVYGLNGNDVIHCSQGSCKAYGGNGNDMIVAGAAGGGSALSTHSELYGGPGNDILVGGTGNSILVGGPGNNQLFAGTGTDYLIGGVGHGATYFDCGATGNGIILDFNPSIGDTKSSDCKYVFSAQ